MSGIAIVHPEWGIFLGVGMGLAFWSAIDCVGQETAPLMTDEAEAQTFLDQWDTTIDKSVFTFHAVQAVAVWATIEELDAAGLSAWTAPMKAERMGPAMRSA